MFTLFNNHPAKNALPCHSTCVEFEFVEVFAAIDALVDVCFILKRYQPVALQISKQTLEQYHNKSKVTKI